MFLKKMWIVPGALLLSLAACNGDEPQVDETTTTAQEVTQGELMEIDDRVSVRIPDGWEAQTGEFPGLEVFTFTIVPEGTPRDALMPGKERVEFAHLTLMNIGPTPGAEGYVEAQIETDRESTQFYSDITELEPIEIGGRTFYGYEGTLLAGESPVPVQYWYGEAGNDTFKFNVYGQAAGEIPQDLLDAMNSVEFNY